MTRPVIEFHDKGECICAPRRAWRHYTVNGVIVPSVSQVVGVIDKSGPLQWYAARVTREGIIQMLNDKRRIPRDERQLHYAMRKYGLSYQDATSDAAERGTAIHAILEGWIESQAWPNPLDYPGEWRGYISGLAKFLRECEPEFRESELIVGSERHGFAGRRDTVAYCTKGKGKLTRSGRGLLDLKTSKAIYPVSMYAQVEGYDLGGIETGEDPTDYRAIVQVSAEGDYEIGYSTATHDTFLAYLAAFREAREVERKAKEAA